MPAPSETSPISSARIQTGADSRNQPCGLHAFGSLISTTASSQFISHFVNVVSSAGGLPVTSAQGQRSPHVAVGKASVADSEITPRCWPCRHTLHHATPGCRKCHSPNKPSAYPAKGLPVFSVHEQSICGPWPSQSQAVPGRSSTLCGFYANFRDFPRTARCRRNQIRPLHPRPRNSASRPLDCHPQTQTPSLLHSGKI